MKSASVMKCLDSNEIELQWNTQLTMNFNEMKCPGYNEI